MITDLIGCQIDNYRIDTLLSEGGMGTVYKAYDLNLVCPVAPKVMHTRPARQPQFQQCFLQEAQAAAQLHNDKIDPDGARLNIVFFNLRQNPQQLAKQLAQSQPTLHGRLQGTIQSTVRDGQWQCQLLALVK